MKITIKEQIEREVEIEFPLSFKDNDTLTYIHCYDSEHAIIVYASTGYFGLSNSEAQVKHLLAIYRYTPELNCDKIDVEAAFNVTIREARENFHPKVSLDSNFATTENLEKL